MIWNVSVFVVASALIIILVEALNLRIWATDPSLFVPLREQLYFTFKV